MNLLFKCSSHQCFIGIIAILQSFVFAANVEQWHPTDLSFTSTNSYSNSFLNVSMSATFTGPNSTTLTIPGFYNGNNTWIVRFSPTKIGNWSYTTSSADAQLNAKTGTVTCVANTNTKVHGKLWIDQTNQHHFIYEDGTKYFLMAAEADWLPLMDFADAAIVKEKQLIDMYASNGFNQVMMDIFASDPTWSEAGHGAGTAYDFGPPDAYPFAGTNSSPDHTKMNPAFFNHYDKVIDYLFTKGIVAHLYFKVYTKQVNYPANYSSGDSLFFKYITSRYQAYPNIIWDFAKESHTMTNNNNTYKKNMLALVKSKDAYRRLVTTHDDDDFFNDASCAATVDFRTDQQHDTWYNTVIGQRNSKNWPIYNAEYGYEWGPGGSGDYTYPVVQDPQTVLKRTFEIVMAGGYPCYYYTNHSWDIVKYDQTPAGLHYYKHLYDFFTRANWSALLPGDNLIGNFSGGHCLASAGSEYIVYFSNGGTATLTIASASGQLAGIWMNAFTGEEQTASNVGNGAQSLTAPWSNVPSVLWLYVAGINTPPTCSFTSPVNGATFSAAASISVTVNAADPDGLISKVDLYLNDVFVRTESAAPYQWNNTSQDVSLQNLAIGTYTLKAIATDNRGAETTSTVTIIVGGTGVTKPYKRSSLTSGHSQTTMFNLQGKVVNSSNYNQSGKISVGIISKKKNTGTGIFISDGK